MVIFETVMYRKWIPPLWPPCKWGHCHSRHSSLNYELPLYLTSTFLCLLYILNHSPCEHLDNQWLCHCVDADDGVMAASWQEPGVSERTVCATVSPGVSLSPTAVAHSPGQHGLQWRYAGTQSLTWGRSDCWNKCWNRLEQIVVHMILCVSLNSGTTV